MRVTVAVCTHNRPTILPGCLEALSRLRIPTGVEWETVLVENGPALPETQRILHALRDRLPVRYFHEPALGVSHARNRAVAETRGEAILWTDDDVRVTPGWMAAYIDALRAHPDVAFFGGPLRLDLEEPVPNWLRRSLDVVVDAYAGIDLGDRLIAIEHQKPPVGGNCAVRTAAQRRHTYDPALGRVGSALDSGEETAVFRAILDEGGRGLWIPEAEGRHFVSRRRQTVRHLRRLYNGFGALDAAARADIERRARWPRFKLARRAVRAEARFWFRRAVRPPEVWIHDLVRCSHRWGLLRAPADSESSS